MIPVIGLYARRANKAGGIKWHPLSGVSVRLGRILPIVAISGCLFSADASAGEGLPVWEVGIGGGAVSMPQYMGSDERYNFAAPVPFVIYRGERVNIDRSGLRADLFGTGEFTVDASLGVGLPVRNTNRARAGMPPLHFSLQAGPRLNWNFLSTEKSDWTLRLPWRGVVDIKGHYLGWVSEPELQLEHTVSDNITLKLNAGALYGSRQFNRYYYDVPALYATAQRPAYATGAGLHSLSASASLSWQVNERLRMFTTLRYRNLSPGVVAGSPLVKTEHYLLGAVGIAWSFYQSDRRTTR